MYRRIKNPGSQSGATKITSLCKRRKEEEEEEEEPELFPINKRHHPFIENLLN